MNKPKLLELFAGDRSIGKVAEKKGFEVFSVDWQKFDNIDLSIDIGYLRPADIPFIPGAVWLSFDCTTYTIAACSKHRNKDRTPKSPEAVECDTVNQHCIKLLKYWLKLNPDMVFFIENPRGILRHMPFIKNFIKDFNRHTVWYCQYGDNRAKPTDIFTNSTTWIPRPMCKNYKYDKEGNIIDKHCHHEGARRGSKTGTQGRKNSYDRSKIPEELCIEIINSIKP